jgi:hypothetical protein
LVHTRVGCFDMYTTDSCCFQHVRY